MHSIEELKSKYDSIVNTRIQDYLRDRGSSDDSVRKLKNSSFSKAYKGLVNSKYILEINNKNFDETSASGRITYSIDIDISVYNSNLTLTEQRSKYKSFTKNYISTIISIISSVKNAINTNGENVKSDLINKLSRSLIDIHQEFYVRYIELETNNIQNIYKNILTRSDNYNELLTQQMGELSSSVESLNSISEILNNNMLDTSQYTHMEYYSMKL